MRIKPLGHLQIRYIDYAKRVCLLLSSLLIGPAVIVPSRAVAAERPRVIAENEASPLTIAEAKALVARSLLDIGQQMVRVGHAEFDGNGNVVVQLVSQEGMPFKRVVVDGKTHKLVGAKDRHTLNG